MLTISFLTFGLVFMDRLSFTFLMPFVVDDLGLSNTQSGWILGILSIFFGLSTLIFSGVSDIVGSKKRMLIAFVILFSLATLAIGFAEDYASLVVIRAIMGITEGPVIPLVLAIVLAQSSVKRRGFNMGLVKGSGPLMSGVLAPIILIPIAVAYSWEWGFYTLAIPGFILAFLIFKFIKSPKIEEDTKEEAEKKPSFKDMVSIFKNRNIILTMLICIFYMINMTSFISFVPLYLTSTLGYEQGELQTYLTLYGLGCFLWFLIVPALSDKFGRKPTLVFFALASILLPITTATLHLSFWPTIILLVLLTCSMGYMPLFDAIIPSESVPHKYAATAMAGTVLTGEVIGGTLGPVISGMMADQYDLHAPFYVGAIGAFIAFLLSLGIKETRSAKAAREEKTIENTTAETSSAIS